MEKRFLLATVISILILTAWTALFRPLHTGTIRSGLSEHIGNKSVKQEIVTPSNVATSSPASVGSPNGAKIETIETSKFIVEFSNIGGTILRVFFKEYDLALPVRGMGGAPEYDHTEFVVEKMGVRDIIYRHETPDLLVRQLYTVSEDDYTIEAQTIIQNKTNMSKLVTWENQGVVLDMSSLDERSSEFVRDRALFEYVISSSGGIERKNNAFKFNGKERKDVLGRVLWAAFRSRYFCAITKPLYDTDAYTIIPLSDNELQLNIRATAVDLAPGASAAFSSLLFIGPEKSELLAQYKSNFEEIKRYYRIALFDAIAKIIDSILHALHKILPNWGVCVILISMFIYGAMYPLTLRSMLSMRKMQEVQPKIAALREKYRDNPQKMNIEVMELYKKYKINPLGGCLPMLLQMPVFIGLYQVLWRSVSFKGAHFLWIKDLSGPDRLFILPFFLPFVGNEINLLPILMIFVMAVQQKLTAKNMGATDPAQMAQQKMMAVIMPFFLGAIFYHFASGLTLYFTLFYAFSTIAQWKMSTIHKAA